MHTLFVAFMKHKLFHRCKYNNKGKVGMCENKGACGSFVCIKGERAQVGETCANKVIPE